MSAKAQSKVERRKEQYRLRDDKKVIEDAVQECCRCGSNDFVRTYYEHLAPDTTCINCGFTS